MKRSLLAISLLGISVTLNASPSFHPAGESLTYGETANHQSLLGYTNNPAAGASSLGTSDWYFGFGILSSVGIGVEIGPVDNMTERVEALSDRIEAFENSSQTIEEVNSIKTEFDDFLLDAGESGYVNLHIGLNLPLMPLVWSSQDTLGGGLVLDANAAAQVDFSILDRPIEYNPLEQGSNVLQTNTAAYLKIAAVAEMSLGYSRALFETNSGTLYAGLRGKYYQVGLRKLLLGISQVDNAEQIIEDEADLEYSGQTGFGADIGLMWVAENFRVGGTFKNVNSPSFDYESIGKDCASKSVSTQDSCYIAESFADEIDLEETWVMDAQASIEGAYFSKNRNWVLSVAADTSPVNDPVGNELQWFTASGAYASNSWILPGVRFGYRKNLAGTELSAVTAGLTLFKMLHLDAAYGLESIEVDGDEIPRMVQVNLGIDLLF